MGLDSITLKVKVAALEGHCAWASFALLIARLLVTYLPTRK